MRFYPDEQIDALIRSGLWQDEQPLTADGEKVGGGGV